MGYWLQLRLILWKNYTVKRRTPLVLLFEVSIPLVLFVILLIIRHKEPAAPRDASHSQSYPLPSAGLAPIMQMFCDGGESTPGEPFKTYPNSSILQFLESFQNISEHNNFFDPGFQPEDMAHLPELYRTIIEDPIALRDTFRKAQNISLDSLFTSKDELLRTLVVNFSIPAPDVQALLNSDVNFTEVYRLLFSGDDGGGSNNSPFTRFKRDLPSPLSWKDTSAKWGQLPDLESHIPDLGLPLGHLGGLPTNPFSGASILPRLNHGLIFKVLKDNPALLLDPEVRDVMGSLLGFSGKRPEDLDPVEVADVLKKLLLNGDALHHMVCDDQDELNRLLIPPSASDKTRITEANLILCDMSRSQWQQLSVFLKRTLSSEKVSQQLDLQHMNLTASRIRIARFVTNLQEFIVFEKNMAEVSALARDFPHTPCHEEGTVPSTLSSQDVTMVTQKTREATTERTEDGDGGHHDKPDNNFGGFLSLWISMQTTFCGRSYISEEGLAKFAKSAKLADLGLSSSQMYSIGILAHALYSNPRILYAPNNTNANLIISKANETFALLDLVSEYARKWLESSADIRAFLLKNDTEANLKSIRQMQQELRALPGLAAMINTSDIRRFIENSTVPDRNYFLGQLDIVDNAACGWLKMIDGISLNVFQGFQSEDELVDYFLNDAYSDNVTVFASVVFLNLNDSGPIPPHVVYKLRQNTTFTPTTKLVRDRYWYPGHYGSTFRYYQFGFVWIQDIIERAIVDIQVGHDVIEPGSYIWEVPYPCYKEDQFLFMIEHVMPLCLTISWVYTVAMLVQGIVYEKEQRLKEVMRTMGLNNSVHWLAWFITTFSQMSITMAILTVMLKYGGVLQYSNVWLIFLMMQVFAIATIAFSFLVSVCYSKAKVAAACAGILYFLTYVPYIYVAIREEAAGDKISAWIKAIASMLSTTAFGLGSKYFAFYEIQGVGIQWDNIRVSPIEGDEFSLFLVILLMVVDALVYALLTWYIENVHPGSFGLPKPWYFPFTQSYWFGHARTEAEQCSWRMCCPDRQVALSITEEDQACAMEDSEACQRNVEADPTHLPLGVCIDKLTKVYRRGKKLAVNKLSLNMYEGQITSFLGHNGAGKTTTMSILTGLFPPTSGNASIYGFDIKTDMEDIRKGLGMCPQHNVLFDKLTVEEHLWFYARLKGTDSSTLDEEMERMIHDVGLPKKRKNTIDCLSGGMQRKLSVAIAFVAGSRTVILDEPTAGVDPYARRAIWDLLIKYKKDRTILLSTHHMDEADILGDRIAIISHGQLKCCGSSTFLKTLFGDGYHLILVKKPSAEDLQSRDTLDDDDLTTSGASFHTRCAESKVTAFLTHHVTTAYLKYESSQELHYILPFDEAKKGSYERLFQVLDQRLDDLDISSYGVMDTSLEEVFLKVTEQGEKTAEEENETNESKEVTLSPSDPVSVPANESPQHIPNLIERDGASLGNASILLGSNDVHDLELGHLAGPRRLLRQDSADVRRSIASFIDCQGNARMGSDADLLDVTSDGGLEEELLRGPYRPKIKGHYRALSTGSNASDTAAMPSRRQHVYRRRGHQRQHSAGANMMGCKSKALKHKGHVRQVSLGSQVTDDVPLLDDGDVVPEGAARGHHRDFSLGSIGSDVSLLDVRPVASGAAAGKVKGHRRQQSTGSIGSSVSLLEYKYAKARGQTTQHSAGLTLPGAASRPAEDGTSSLNEGRSSHRIVGSNLLFQQFWAIIVKRFYYVKRNWKGLFSQILLPALFVCIAMSVALTAPKVTDLPPIVLSPAQYYNYTQPDGNYIPVSSHPQRADADGGAPDEAPDIPEWSQDAAAAEVLATFHMPAGVAATCVLRKAFNSSFNDAILKEINATHRDFRLLEKYFGADCASVFVQGFAPENFLPPAPTAFPSVPENSSMARLVPSDPTDFYPDCHCSTDRRGQVCSKGAYNHPPEYQAITADRLQDITARKEDDYLLNTYDSFRLKRYGGLSLGRLRDFVPEDFGKGAPAQFRKLAVRSTSMIRYSEKGYHSLPIYINTLNNAILRANLPPQKGNPSAYGITAYNHPMNNTNDGLSMTFILQGSDVLIAIFIICAMSFVPASFVLFLVYERSIKAKHLQVVSGLSRVIYWVANYVWDMCNYLIPATCCILILKSFDVPAYVSGANFPAVISLFLLYGWSITPMMYPASFVFTEPSTAYIFLIVINLFVGITCIITSFLLELFQNNEELLKIHDVLKCIFLVFPNYCLGRGLMDIAFNEYWNEYFFKTGQYGKMKSPFEWNLMARNLVAMAIVGLVFFLITLMCEFNFFRKPKPVTSDNMMMPHEEDADVANERRRATRGSGRRDMLRLENLTKIYVTRKLGRHLAVDRLSLGVPEGECFGLLGVNGAGKTTTFKMLTGDLPPTGGDAYLNGYSILKDVYKVQEKIGYCPQFDALYDELTAREHLQLYARLRGIPCQEQKQVVDWAVHKLGLGNVADKLSGTYSGGMKRKLSTAIALIGQPPVIFLDEPTTGMDPHSRRFLWDLILNLIQEGRSVILTSHSMEECEALCTRMAIMVNGHFKCLGSVQHLKTRFGDGYTVSVRVKGPAYERNVETVSRFIERHFQTAMLKECHHNMVQYELPSLDLALSRVFALMEEASRDLNVVDYSVSQNTLDNVFINFVKQQQELVQESGQLNTAHLTPVPQNAELQPLVQCVSSSDENLMYDDEDSADADFEPTLSGLAFQPDASNC